MTMSSLRAGVDNLYDAGPQREGVRGWATVQYWEGDLRPVGLTADGVTATRIIQIAMTSVRCSFPISVCRPLLVSRVH